MKMNTPKSRFLFMVGLPLLILLALTIKPLSTHYFGEVVQLKTRPVDPADLFYGDYIALNLAINEIPYEKVGKDVISELDRNEEELPAFSGNLTVYTVLDPNGEVKETVLSKPKDGMYLKGRLTYYDINNKKETIHVDYGLNRFYIEEGSGDEIEKLAEKGDVLVSVRIRNGYGIIEELIKQP